MKDRRRSAKKMADRKDCAYHDANDHMPKIIREKRHRLSPELYRGLTIVSITACVKDKVAFFTMEDRFAVFQEILLDELKRFECGSDVYLFMPDHAHLMLRGDRKRLTSYGR